MMSLKSSLCIALLGIVLGLAIAIVFGINEDFFKKRITKGIQNSSQYMITENKSTYMKKESAKNWRYYQRFHFHSSAIGSMSIVLLLLIHFINIPFKREAFLSILLSVSGFLYPFVWLFAGIYGPEWGRDEAKEFFAIFGHMGGVYLMCVIWLLLETIKSKSFMSCSKKEE